MIGVINICTFTLRSDQKAMPDSDTSSDSSSDSDTEYTEYPARFDQANLVIVRGGTVRGNDKLVEKQGYAFTVLVSQIYIKKICVNFVSANNRNWEVQTSVINHAVLGRSRHQLLTMQ